MKSVAILILFAAGAILFAGCKGVPAPGEKQARRDFNAVEKQFHPQNRAAVLPQLTPDSSLSNFVEYALLNSPTVGEAFYDWSASVENITVERSMPDPQLVFQAYIEHTLTSLMPGLFQTIPGPGKLKARGHAAAAESQAKYFAFESAVLQAAFNLKSAYYKLGELDEQLRIHHEKVSLLENQEHSVRSQYQTGAATLSELLRVQSDYARVSAEHANMEDSLPSALQNFKAALGLRPAKADPPIPKHFETSGENIDAAELRRVGFERNPQLKAMESDVRAAEAGIAVAYKERVPNFSAGLMAEVYSPPFYWPQASMSLPIWRDKIAAEIARAKANELTGKSKLKSAQIDLAVNFAEQLFAYHETSRNLALIENDLIPKAKQTIETVRTGYRTGRMDFSALTDAEQTLLELQLEAVETKTDREIALADLTLMVAGVPPVNAPLLSNNSQP
ncbi:MAG: TolC family protein [Limisphaerales bacterium]